MEMTDLRGLATLFCFVAFVAVVYWAYGPSRKEYFNEAAQLPFDDDTSGAQGNRSSTDE